MTYSELLQKIEIRRIQAVSAVLKANNHIFVVLGISSMIIISSVYIQLLPVELGILVLGVGWVCELIYMSEHNNDNLIQSYAPSYLHYYKDIFMYSLLSISTEEKILEYVAGKRIDGQELVESGLFGLPSSTGNHNSGVTEFMNRLGMNTYVVAGQYYFRTSKYSMSHVTITKQNSKGVLHGRLSKTQKIFDGYVFILPFKNNFDMTLITSKMYSYAQTSNLNRVRLESPVFQRLFNVHSTNPINARMFLKTNVMQSLVEFVQSENKIIAISLKNGKLYMAISFESKLIEPKLFKSYNHKDILLLINKLKKNNKAILSFKSTEMV